MADNIRLNYCTHYDIENGFIFGIYKGPILIKSSKKSRNSGIRVKGQENVLILLRLYRFFLKEYTICKKRKNGIFGDYIPKGDLKRLLFSDYPGLSHHKFGRVIRVLVPYLVSFQKFDPGRSNKSWKMTYRWGHPLDFVYGIEHLFALWLPDHINSNGGSCYTEDDFNEEMEILRDQSPEEEARFIAELKYV